jgi:hypothetical protein
MNKMKPSIRVISDQLREKRCATALPLLIAFFSMVACAPLQAPVERASEPSIFLPTCHGVEYGAVKAGAQSIGWSKENERDAVVILREGVRSETLDGHGRAAVLDLSTRTATVAWWFVGEAVALAPPRDSIQIDSYEANDRPGEPRSVQFTRRLEVSQKDTERIVCAANDFWRSEREVGQQSHDSSFAAIVVHGSMHKSTWGQGRLTDEAAEVARSFWALIPPMKLAR